MSKKNTHPKIRKQITAVTRFPMPHFCGTPEDMTRAFARKIEERIVWLEREHRRKFDRDVQEFRIEMVAELDEDGDTVEFCQIGTKFMETMEEYNARNRD